MTDDICMVIVRYTVAPSGPHRTLPKINPSLPHQSPDSSRQKTERPRSYLGPTCPSYNKLGPLLPNQPSSRDILSKFLSQPDDVSCSLPRASTSGLSCSADTSGTQMPFQARAIHQHASPSASTHPIGRTPPRQAIYLGAEQRQNPSEGLPMSMASTSSSHDPSIDRRNLSGDRSGLTTSTTVPSTSTAAQVVRQQNKFGEIEYRWHSSLNGPKKNQQQKKWYSFWPRLFFVTDLIIPSLYLTRFRCQDCLCLRH